MGCVDSFEVLLQLFAEIMNQSASQAFGTLVAGWLLAPRRSIMGMVRESGTGRCYVAFRRVFAPAKWLVNRVGLGLFGLLAQGREIVCLGVDGTLLGCTGLKVFGAGMHCGLILSSRSFPVTRSGINGWSCASSNRARSRQVVRVATSCGVCISTPPRSKNGSGRIARKAIWR